MRKIGWKGSARRAMLEASILLVLYLLNHSLEKQSLRIYLRAALLHLSVAHRNLDFNQGVTGRGLIVFHSG
jgi:hypothetical protein